MSCHHCRQCQCQDQCGKCDDDAKSELCFPHRYSASVLPCHTIVSQLTTLPIRPSPTFLIIPIVASDSPRRGQVDTPMPLWRTPVEACSRSSVAPSQAGDTTRVTIATQLSTFIPIIPLREALGAVQNRPLTSPYIHMLPSMHPFTPYSIHSSSFPPGSSHSNSMSPPGSSIPRPHPALVRCHHSERS